MITIYTIKNSPQVKPLMDFLKSKKFKVNQESVNKFIVDAPDIRSICGPIADYLLTIPKEMEINTEPIVGYTVFAKIQNGKNSAYIMSNDKSHKKINRRAAKVVKMLLI